MKSMTGSSPRQRGAILNGWISGLVLLAGVMFVVLKVLPVYVDHNFLVSSTRSLLESRNAGSLSQTEVRNEIAQSLRLNNIRGVSSRHVVLVRSGNSPAARITYERRVPLVYNIELAIQFDETVE